MRGVLSRVYQTLMRTPCRKTPQYPKEVHSYAEGPTTEHLTARRLGCAEIEPAQCKVQLLGFPSGCTLLRCRPPLTLPSPFMNTEVPILTTQKAAYSPTPSATYFVQTVNQDSSADNKIVIASERPQHRPSTSSSQKTKHSE